MESLRPCGGGVVFVDCVRQGGTGWEGNRLSRGVRGLLDGEGTVKMGSVGIRRGLTRERECVLVGGGVGLVGWIKVTDGLGLNHNEPVIEMIFPYLKI
jgi:hypothetical protein